MLDIVLDTRSGLPLVYSPSYRIDIGSHVYPTTKYCLVFDAVREQGVPVDVTAPEPLTWEQLATVHTPDYLDKLRTGGLTPEEVQQLEIPWSPGIVEGFRLMSGGTLVAARAALDRGASAHVGGGFHHAFPNHGEGFCMFNDVACAIRVLQADGRIRRAAVVDLDVHQGNGTAFVFANDPSVFTFSMHQQHNYPMWKPASDIDIGLGDGCRDHGFLEKLEAALPKVLASAPDIVVYVAGADPFVEDQLGGLSLTHEGLRRRDEVVIAACRSAGVPVAVTLAGGYARRLEDTVAIHVTTIETLQRRTAGL